MQRLGDGQARVVDHEVDAAEGQGRAGERAGDVVLAGDVSDGRDGHVGGADGLRDGLGRLRVAVGDDDAGALGGEAPRGGPADAGAAAGDQGDPALQGLGLGAAAQLGLLELPVLDAELLAFRDGRVGRDRLGAAHHVDRVEVELARDPRGLLVGAEAEHADARDKHDRRVGAAHRRGVRRGVPLVVGLVVGAVGLVQLPEPGGYLIERRVRRQVEHHRPDLGAQEVVGAGGAERGQARRASRCR